MTVVLFLIEVSIALFIEDSIVRPFIGDVLVVVLIYCFLRIFLNLERLWVECMADFSLPRRRASLAAEQAEACSTFLPYIQSINALNYWKTAFGVLLFACLIEILQYFDYVKLLGLEQNRVLSVALGRTFALLDFIAYFAGFTLIILTESFYKYYRTD